MIPFLRTWILNIVTVIIFITFLELLLPKSSMKKYIKMIVGLLVMLVILNPVIELIHGKSKIQDEIFHTSSMIDKKNLSLNISNFEKVNNQQLIAMYKENIKNDIIHRLKYTHHVDVSSVSVKIEEDKHSNSFGDIKELAIYLLPTPTNEPSAEGIKPVSIIVGENLQLHNHESIQDPQLMDDMKTSISDLYGLDKSKININQNN